MGCWSVPLLSSEMEFGMEKHCLSVSCGVFKYVAFIWNVQKSEGWLVAVEKKTDFPYATTALPRP